MCVSKPAFVFIQNTCLRFQNANVQFSFTYTDATSLDFGKPEFVFQNLYLCFFEIRICVFKTQTCDSVSLTLILHR